MRSEARAAAHGLRLRVRRDVPSTLTGAYQSAFRGRGLTFEELRDYSPGDDANAIEWKATARLGRPIVKLLREERDLLVAPLVDVSASLACGIEGQTKQRAARLVAGTLAWAATQSRDRIALALFAERLHAVLKPAAGPLQLERVFRMLETTGGTGPTDAVPPLRWAFDALPRRALVVLITDLHFADPGAALARCARKHEVVVIALRSSSDLPPQAAAPISCVRSAESTRRTLWRPHRRAAPPILSGATLRRSGAELIEIASDETLIPALHAYFATRGGHTA